MYPFACVCKSSLLCAKLQVHHNTKWCDCMTLRSCFSKHQPPAAPPGHNNLHHHLKVTPVEASGTKVQLQQKLTRLNYPTFTITVTEIALYRCAMYSLPPDTEQSCMHRHGVECRTVNRGAWFESTLANFDPTFLVFQNKY